MSSLETFKAQFDTNLCHLNNAGLAPISARARDVVKLWADRFYREGYFADAAYESQVQSARSSLARLLKTIPARIAFFGSTSVAISQVAFGIKLKPSEEIITGTDEYGSNLFPWREACARSGAKLVKIPFGPGGSFLTQSIIDAVTANTKVIAVSWVQFQTGAVLDLKTLGEFCQQRGIFLVVDGIQGVGLFDMDVTGWGIDALCGGSHKWLVSPVGVGYLAVSSRLLSELQPLHVGAQTYGSCDDPTSELCVLKSDASRFEPGAKASIEIMALGASVDLINETRTEVIEGEVQRLAQRLRRGLDSCGYRIICPHTKSEQAFDHSQQRGSIVSFTSTPKSPLRDNMGIYTLLRQQGINAVIRGNGIRLSPHAFNKDSDIDFALSVLAE